MHDVWMGGHVVHAFLQQPGHVHPSMHKQKHRSARTGVVLVVDQVPLLPVPPLEHAPLGCGCWGFVGVGCDA